MSTYVGGLTVLFFKNWVIMKTQAVYGEISGSHGYKYEDDCLLGCCDCPDDGVSKHLWHVSQFLSDL
jgi:hypothetical protein